MRHRLVPVLALLAASGLALARPDFTYSGPQVLIPDGIGVGSPGTAASIQVSVPSALTIASISCSVYIPHTFQGDLLIKLTHVESGRTATLIDRPYVPQTALGFPAPDYGSTATPLRFADTGVNAYDYPAVAPPGISAVSGVWKPQTSLATFVGQNAQGTWRLSATDYAAGDTGSLMGFTLSVTGVSTCYANCDGSTASPFLNAGDFMCFMNRFAASDPYVNCDASLATPALNILDFQCFLNRFAAGCSAP